MKGMKNDEFFFLLFTMLRLEKIFSLDPSRSGLL